MNLKAIQTQKDDLKIIFTTKNIIRDLSKINNNFNNIINKYLNNIKD